MVWRIEAEEAGRFIDFSSDYRMLNYLGEALAPSLRGINTFFAPPSDPFEYGCLTDAFSVSGYVRDDNDTPLPGITVASASGRTAVTNADGYYILPGLVTGTYTIVPTQTGYTFLPETDAASVPPSVENLDFVGAAPPLTVEVLDPQSSPVTSLSTNTEGWPTPNPLLVEVTLTCPAGGADCDYSFNLTIDSDDNNARFYLYDKDLSGDGIEVECEESFTGSDYSHESYLTGCVRVGAVTALTLFAGETKTMHWSVWVQPSEAAVLDVSAIWGDHTDNKPVSVPQAQIHPLVVIPGYVGTWPPEHGGDLDPLQKTYDNLIEALQRIGYEFGEAGSGATLIPFGWDWRAPIGDSGRVTLEADIDSIRDVANQTKDYVDYDKVDIVAHSAGGLVARAFIEDASANNQDEVNRLITLGSPHRGAPAAYRGGRGGQYNALFPGPDGDMIASAVTAGLLFCEDNFWRDIAVLFPGLYQDRIKQEIVLDEDVFYAFIKEYLPSANDLLPTSNVTPEYIVDNLNPSVPYPYGNSPGTPPDNPFLEDMSTSGGNYDVSKLLVPNIISMFSPNHSNQAEGVYKVNSPPYGQGDNVRWGHGEVVDIDLVPGDGLIPAYSADLTQLSALSGASNITASDAITIHHMALPAESIMVRRIISYVTGINVVNNATLWTKAIPQPPGQAEALWQLVTCSPIRTLVTDPLGRQAGLDLDTGAIINEIPDAIVTKDGDDPHLIIVPQIEGQYQVQTMGIGNGEYTIGALEILSGTTEVVARVFTGTTTTGQSRQFSFDSSVFQEENGQVVMEAERFTGQVGAPDRAWISQTVQAGYVGAGYLNTPPDIDQIYTEAFTSTASQLEYTINFTTPGTYTVWIRGYAINAAGDSLYVSLDDQPPTTLTGFPPRQWAWQDAGITFEVTEPEEYTLFLWQREDGLRIDRIVLTVDDSYNPQGNGPDESPRIGED